VANLFVDCGATWAGCVGLVSGIEGRQGRRERAAETNLLRWV